MRILITGGNGFIGSNLVQELTQQSKNLEIYCITRSYEKLKNLSSNNLHLIKHDLLSEDLPKGLPKNIDVIYHLAALSKTFLKQSEARKQFIENITLTSNVIKLSEKLATNKIIYGSSVYVYSGTESIPFSENMPLLPEEFLGASKLSSELLLKAYSLSSEVNIYSLRLFTVYGEGSRDNQFIPETIRKLTTSNPEAKFGNPEVTRDFVYISDVVRALILSLESNIKGYNPINIASGEAISISEAVEIMQNLLNSKKDIKFEDKKLLNNKGDSSHSAKIDLAYKILGWKPEIRFQNGIQMTIENFLSKE
jgi:UDP-glucose 4-epimerase